MFMHVAEVVGKEYGLEPIQHLDLLVRDWSSSQVLGAQGGKKHLRHIRQGLETTSPCKHPKALEALKRISSCCYLMPFPGKWIVMGSEGTLRDMDEDFQESLRDYVTALVSLASRHVRRDQHGELLTGMHLAAWIKHLSDVMKKHRSGFSSPCQMAITFHNQNIMNRTRREHADFLNDKDSKSRNMFYCLKVRPSKMAEQFVEQRMELLWWCQTDMQEPAPEKEALLMELEAELKQEAETFLETYRKRFKKFVIAAGIGTGALVLAPVGGAAGVGVAAAALDIAQAAAIGAGVGAVAGMCVGGGVGWGVGENVTWKDNQRAEATASQRERGDGTEEQSDEAPLIRTVHPQVWGDK